MRHFSRICSGALVLAAALSLSGCASEPLPDSWQDSDFNQRYEDVANAAVSLLVSRFEFAVDSSERDKNARTVHLRTGWNYGSASGAVMSGQGVRRKAFVNVEEVYVDDERVLPLPGEGSQGERDTTKDKDKGPQPRVVIRSGKHMLAKTRISVAVLRERNMDMTAPGATENGDWHDDGLDEEMTAQILDQLRSRLSGGSSKGLELSAQTREALEKYWKDEYLTPEERERRFKDLRTPEKR